jgi:hypothetical protein
MKLQGVTAEIQNEILPAVKLNAERRAPAVPALAYAVVEFRTSTYYKNQNSCSGL